MSALETLKGKLFPTIVVGSHAAPGWLFNFRNAIRDGKAGPDDISEAFDDAARVAILDQMDAGIDVISDGELRRQRFVYEMYDRLAGLERQSVGRKLGLPGYDMAPNFNAHQRLTAPHGLGLVDELDLLRRNTRAGEVILKIALPGPLTFAGNILPGKAYETENDSNGAVLADLVRIIRDNLIALEAAGCQLIQLDEPGLPHPPYGLSIAEGTEIINETLAGLKTTTAVHVCFGNNVSRPVAPRGFDRLFPGLDKIASDILLLEFANREMAGLNRLQYLRADQIVAAGVIDVKSFHVESAEEVLDRIEQILQHISPERLWLTADCGFSAIPRWLAQKKLQALQAGATLARDRFS